MAVDTIMRREVEVLLILRETAAEQGRLVRDKERDLLERKRRGARLEPSLALWIVEFAKRTAQAGR